MKSNQVNGITHVPISTLLTFALSEKIIFIVFVVKPISHKYSIVIILQFWSQTLEENSPICRKIVRTAHLPVSCCWWHNLNLKILKSSFGLNFHRWSQIWWLWLDLFQPSYFKSPDLLPFHSVVMVISLIMFSLATMCVWLILIQDDLL